MPLAHDHEQQPGMMLFGNAAHVERLCTEVSLPCCTNGHMPTFDQRYFVPRDLLELAFAHTVSVEEYILRWSRLLDFHFLFSEGFVPTKSGLKMRVNKVTGMNKS